MASWGGEANALMAVLMGVSLAACAGLRAFLPLLAVGVAARWGWWPVQPWLQWIGSNEALITFGVASILEIAADKVPVLDHALDTFHTVARPIAGALAAMGAAYQVNPVFALALGIIVGAPLAGSFHVTKASTRVASTTLTAGTANPVLSVAEDFAAVFGVILAIVAPVLAFLGVLIVGALIYRFVRSRRPRQVRE